MLARYLDDGTLDRSFGEDGIVHSPFGIRSHAHAAAVQADGKVVVAGIHTGNYDHLLFTRPG